MKFLPLTKHCAAKLAVKKGFPPEDWLIFYYDAKVVLEAQKTYRGK